MTLTLAGLPERLRAHFEISVPTDRPPGPTVTTPAEFHTAMKAAAGGDAVYLAPGVWPLLTLTGYGRPKPVLILPADPAKPPVLCGLKLSGCTNITVRGLEFMFDPAAPAILFEVSAGFDIGAEGCQFHGPVDATHARRGSAARFRGTTRFAFVNNHVHDLYKGVDHFMGAVDASYGVIAGNEFHDINSDGVTGCSDYTLVFGNVGHDFHRVDGNHPDFIQFGTAGAWKKTSPIGIRVFGNVYYPGQGTPVQGIFMKNEQSAFRYRETEVTRNGILGGMYHGVTLSRSVGAKMIKNFVQGMEGVVDSADKDMHAWLKMGESEGGEVSGNVTSRAINLDANLPTPTLLDNTRVRLAPAGDASDLLAWADKEFPVAADAPVPDPRDETINALEAKVASLTRDLATAGDKALEQGGLLTEAGARLTVAKEQIVLTQSDLEAERSKVAGLKDVLGAIAKTAADATSV